MANNVEDSIRYLIYWEKKVTGLPGYKSGQKINAPNSDYFTIAFVNKKRISKNFQIESDVVDEETLLPSELDKFNSYHNAELTFRITCYGDNCNYHITNLESSLEDSTPSTDNEKLGWALYLKKYGLAHAKSGEITFSDSLEFTEFLDQSQFNVTFNTIFANKLTLGYIDTATAGLSVDSGQEMINEDIIVLQVDTENNVI